MNRHWIALIAIAVFLIVPIAVGATVDVVTIATQTRELARRHASARVVAQPVALVAVDHHRGPPATS